MLASERSGVVKTFRYVPEPNIINESFDIVPGTSVGPFYLGMPRSEIQALFKCPITSFFKTPDSTQRTDDFSLLGVHVHYGDDACANYIEAHMPVQYNDVKHHLDGNLVTGLTVGQLREICDLLAHPLVDFDCGFEIPALGLNVYSHDYQSDESPVDAISVMSSV